MALKVNRTAEPSKTNLPGSVFYKEDLRKIYEILKGRQEDHAIVKAKIAGNDKIYEIDQIEDFDDPELKCIRFRSINYEASYGDSYILVEISRESGKLEALNTAEETPLEVISEMILDLAKKRENHLRDASLFALMIGFWIPFYLFFHWISKSPILEPWADAQVPLIGAALGSSEAVEILSPLLYAPFIFWAIRKMKFKGNAIINASKEESPLLRNRIRKNWDVNLIWVGAGAMIGLFLGRAFNLL